MKYVRKKIYQSGIDQKQEVLNKTNLSKMF